MRKAPSLVKGKGPMILLQLDSSKVAFGDKCAVQCLKFFFQCLCFLLVAVIVVCLHSLAVDVLNGRKHIDVSMTISAAASKVHIA